MHASVKLFLSISVSMLCTACISRAGDGDHQKAVSILMKASYQHLKIAHLCKSALGEAAHRDARILIENAIRATGLPTDIALKSAAEISTRVAAESLSRQLSGLNDCITRVTISKSEVAKARAAVALHP